MPEVFVKKGEPIDRALKRLKTKLDSEGIMDEIRRQDAIPGNGPRHDIRWLQVGYKWQF